MKNFNQLQILLILAILALSCNKPSKKESPNGLWRVELSVNKDKRIPFFLTIGTVNDTLKAVIWNGKEQIIQNHVFYRNDSIVIESDHFRSELVFIQNKNKMKGYWHNKARKGSYKIPAFAMYNLNQRFSFDSSLKNTIDGTWETKFSPNTINEYSAIGVFKTGEHSTTGTFATETGDYRFLEGGFDGKNLKLSTFDGAHAFLFEAVLSNDSLRGTFWSGKHWEEPFIAWRNEKAVLANPFELSHSTGKNSLSLNAIDLHGNKVSLRDKRFKGKGIVLQIMGTWCPNCLDESRFLKQNYENYKSKNIEIVALAFEKLVVPEALTHLKKYKKALNLPYTIWYVGKNSKQNTLKTLPFIDKVRSYPTLVFILPNGEVTKIYTGYYGPSTGKMHSVQVQKMQKTINEFSKQIEKIQNNSPS